MCPEGTRQSTSALLAGALATHLETLTAHRAVSHQVLIPLNANTHAALCSLAALCRLALSRLTTRGQTIQSHRPRHCQPNCCRRAVHALCPCPGEGLWVSS